MSSPIIPPRAERAGAPEVRRVQTFVRPPRAAILLPEDASPEALVHTLQQMSWIWGGHYTLLIPTNGKAIDDVFWDHLEAFDPDRIWATDPNLICGRLANELDERLCPLYAWPNTLIRASPEAPAGWWPQTGLPALLAATGREALNVVDLDTFPILGQLYFYSVFGSLAPAQLAELGKQESLRDARGRQVVWRGEVHPWKYNYADRSVRERLVQNLLALLWEKQDYSLWDLALRRSNGHPPPPPGPVPASIWPNLPFAVGMEGLGYLTYDREGRSLGLGPAPPPWVVVCGSTIRDWCLYRNLLALRDVGNWTRRAPDVHWCPYPVVKQSPAKERPLWKAITDRIAEGAAHCTTDNWPVSLVSLSEPPSALSALRRMVIAEARGHTQSRTDGVRHGCAAVTNRAQAAARKAMALVTPSSPDQCLPFFYRFAEVNSAKGERVQFWSLRAATWLPPRIPTCLKEQLPGHVGWVVDLEIEGYQLPRRPSLVEGHLEGQHDIWRPDRTNARVARGGLAYQPLPRTWGPGWDYAAMCATPQLSLLPSEEIFDRLLASKGWRREESDKGKYLRNSLHRFDSLHEFAAFLRQDSSRSLCDRFRDGEQSPPGGFLCASRRVYCNAQEVRRITGLGTTKAAQLLDDWVTRRLLRRGLILKCRHCDYLDWYTLEDLDDTFRCQRCLQRQIWLTPPPRKSRGHIDHRLAYGLDEAFFQFVKNNGEIVVWAIDKILGEEKRYPLWLPEQVVYRARTRIGEVDGLALVRGHVVVVEAKCQNKLEAKQAGTYAAVCQALRADNFVFASTQETGEHDVGRVLRAAGATQFPRRVETIHLSSEPSDKPKP